MHDMYNVYLNLDQSLSHRIRGHQQLGSSKMNGGSNNAELGGTQLDNSCQSKPKVRYCMK